jgi:hypothetical protein
MKTLLSLTVWFIFGFVGIVILISTTGIQTPSWQYTVNSTVGAGSAITVSQLAAERAAEKVGMADRGPEGVGNGGASSAYDTYADAREQELLHAETPLPLTAQKTIDLGAPAALICVYLLGSIMTYGLKRRRHPVFGE